MLCSRSFSYLVDYQTGKYLTVSPNIEKVLGIKFISPEVSLVASGNYLVKNGFLKS
jgi:hypothetical protein